MVAATIVSIGWNSKQVVQDNTLLVLAVAYLAVGAFDFLHVLSYKGMGVFADRSANLPTQLWIAARYLESGALVWAALQAKCHAWATPVFWLHVLATTLLFGAVSWSKFAHMFFKPAAAFEKRISAANGTRSNLPAPSDQPETLGSADHRPGNY